MESNAARLAAADILRLGRKTYELFKGFWPPMADHPYAAGTVDGSPREGAR